MDKIITQMVGHEPNNLYPPHNNESCEVVFILMILESLGLFRLPL